MVLDIPKRTLISQSAGLLSFPRIYKTRLEGRAFSYQEPVTSLGF